MSPFAPNSQNSPATVEARSSCGSPSLRSVRQNLGTRQIAERSLTESEAAEAMAMILAGDVLPEQLGAFLMLLRLKEETSEEIAGFVRASRKTLDIPAEAPRVDLDWSSYAGKTAPVAVVPALRARTCAGGMAGFYAWRRRSHARPALYLARVALARFEPAQDLDKAAKEIIAQNFAYVTLDTMCARLSDMMGLKPILGLRSPGQQLFAPAQPLRGAGRAAERVPPRLHAPASRRGKAARPADAGGVPRRGRGDRAAAQ